MPTPLYHFSKSPFIFKTRLYRYFTSSHLLFCQTNSTLYIISTSAPGFLQKVSPGPTAPQSYFSPPPYLEATPTNMTEYSNETMGGASSDDSQVKSPSSPKFQAPPIRTAALKSMFPQVNVVSKK